MSDMGPDKTDTDWRARPSGDSDDGPHRRDDAFGESEFFLALFHSEVNQCPLSKTLFFFSFHCLCLFTLRNIIVSGRPSAV